MMSEEVHTVVEIMLDHGTWEPCDSWGNGQLTLTDEQSILAAEEILRRIRED